MQGNKGVEGMSLYRRLDRVAFELLSLMCTFEKLSECIMIISFDSESFIE